MLDLYLQGAAVVFAGMTLLWLVSIPLRDVSIIDSFWSLGFVACAWIYHLGYGAEGGTFRGLHLALVTLWGLRLALHIAVRHARHGEEDSRYRAMRRKAGDAFVPRSLLTVFWLQGALICLIVLPLLFVQAGERSTGDSFLATPWAGWLWTDLLAILLFAIGFFFEAVGDWQLTRFKSDPANRGKVLDTGLWRYTRHPNYFGDAVVWWSFFVAALGSAGGWMTLPSALLMNFFLLKVSGVALLEKTITERRPAYRRYIEATPAFFPGLPKSVEHDTEANPSGGTN